MATWTNGVSTMVEGVVPAKWLAPESLHFRQARVAVWCLCGTWSAVHHQERRLDVRRLLLGDPELGREGGARLVHCDDSRFSKPFASARNIDMPDLIEAGERLPRVEGCDEGMYDLLLRCWEYDADARPLFNGAQKERRLQHFTRAQRSQQRWSS